MDIKNFFLIDKDKSCYDASNELSEIISRYQQDSNRQEELKDLILVSRELTFRKESDCKLSYLESWLGYISSAFSAPESFSEEVIFIVERFKFRYPHLLEAFQEEHAETLKKTFYEMVNGELAAIFSLRLSTLSRDKRQEDLRKIVEGRKEARRFIKQYCKEKEGLNQENKNEPTVIIEKKNETVKTNKIPIYEQFLKEHSPESICETVKQFVVAQDEAVRKCSRILYEHMVSIVYPEYELEKTNYLVIGPTGCGKTEIWRQLAKISPVPIVILDTSNITQTGFKGNDKEDLLLPLLKQYEDIEKGIVVFDEFDKICKPSWTSKNENINQNIQAGMLKMFEGVPLQKDSDSMQTKDITFICAGAFVGLSELSSEGSLRHGLGFGSVDVDNRIERNLTECLIEYGMIPELAGRICNAITLNELSREDYLEILASAKESAVSKLIHRYRCCYNVDISFTDEAFRKTAEYSYKSKLGVRSMGIILRNTIEGYLPGQRLRMAKSIVIGADDIQFGERKEDSETELHV